MLQIIEHPKFNEIVATEGFLHKVGDKNYSEIKRSILLPSLSIEDYEEIMELPKHTEEDYKKKVRELIAQRYDIEDEIALINNKDMDAKHLAEYNEYMAYREECKNYAKGLLENGKESNN